MPTFRNINVAGTADAVEQSRLNSFSRPGMAVRRGFDAAMESSARELAASGAEAASRLYLQTFLEDAGSEQLLEITAPNRAELVPDMVLEAATTAPPLKSSVVAYAQSARNIPIFGGRVVVDVDADSRSFVAMNGKVTPMPNVSPLAELSPMAAWKALLEWSGHQPAPAAALPSPILTWFLQEDDGGSDAGTWRLAYHFKRTPLAPRPDESDEPVPGAGAHRFCVGHFRRQAHFDYFVDAHDGEVFFYFSSGPTLDVPSDMLGVDAFGNSQRFFGLFGGGGFLLHDPVRNIQTYDYRFQDIDANAPIPPTPISHPSADLGTTSPEAVSAHYHAKLVFDFFNDALKRKGIDDKGMRLISVVNVYSSQGNPLPSPQWGNAVWWDGKMWYGQENGQSFARHLDVIAHELTHGVTETTSNLIYRDLPGALNESFSDVFGVAVANWYPASPQPVSTWTWEIGRGLGSGGGPIRNFADPAATGQPDHMNQYVKLPVGQDNGGVHIYSGIHNKAVHNLLMDPTVPTVELMQLLYLTLVRLTPTSDFSDCRRTLESVTSTYHAGNAANRAARLASIAAAYGAVGIV